ncbi:CPBP family intramembrane metalloprotease [Adhaeribacter sp. BT258]|uniref:CPBP family intramembrane metalloprotease n=1 Tax=Adhaeribacter terrigena TaxID=2793070 RepID=A0ABS1C8L5_9BACT|nr:CPBP family intramembrane glutamic endopeptidase [Adhaeribacter terrigena]MBK0404930.1 CPBP family intramembrane metalloprotease [Adhaeribacter terrigena]
MKGFISPQLHPFTKILLLLGFMVGGICVGMFVALLGLNLFFGLSVADISQITVNPQAFPNGRAAMVFYQLATHFFMFTAAPLVFIALAEPSVKRYLFAKKNYVGLLLLSALLALVIMPANSWLINWNAKMVLPEALAGFELWAKEKEETLAELTKFLTRFDTLGQMLVGLVAFALVPAIGEELVFRGVLQKNLARLLKNHHVAIWLTAFIFGAIHVQFYGFFPRMLLGGLFGYLYFWSKNLWVPIAAHFMNNGFTVFMLYLQQQNLIKANVESTDSLPWHLGLVSLVMSLLLLFYLKKRYENTPENCPETAAS